jgi:hypothetical protein
MQRNWSERVVMAVRFEDTTMQKTVWSAAMALSLLGSSSVLAQSAAPAQEQSPTNQSFPAQPERSGQTRAPDHTVPPPPEAQPQAPLADQSKPAAVGPAQANSAGSLPSETPPGATGQTMPSTISKENAALDKLPTTAMQFPLTDEQKKLVAKSVAAAPKTETNPELSKLHVAMFLPIGTPTQEFSGELTQQFPPASRYKYIKVDDRILIVDPPNQTVVGEISVN